VLHDCSSVGTSTSRAAGRGEAKYWLEPVVEQAATRGYTGRDLSRIERRIRDNREALIRAWDEACEGEPT